MFLETEYACVCNWCFVWNQQQQLLRILLLLLLLKCAKSTTPRPPYTQLHDHVHQRAVVVVAGSLAVWQQDGVGAGGCVAWVGWSFGQAMVVSKPNTRRTLADNCKGRPVFTDTPWIYKSRRSGECIRVRHGPQVDSRLRTVVGTTLVEVGNSLHFVVLPLVNKKRFAFASRGGSASVGAQMVQKPVPARLVVHGQGRFEESV